MGRLLHRLVADRRMRSCAMCESLEDRRLLSAAAGLTLHRIAHLSAVSGTTDSIEIATVSGPTIAALNTNYTGAGVGLNGSPLVASVQWGTGRSAVHLNAVFTTTASKDTLEISSIDTLSINLSTGVHPLRVTLSENGKTFATLRERVNVLPRPVKGLALQAVAGSAFAGTVGYITAPLEFGQWVGIDWGDHTNDPYTVQTGPESDGMISVESSHTYTTPGKYLITISVGIGGTIGADARSKEVLSRITVFSPPIGG